MAVFHFTLGNALSLKDDSSPNSGGKAYFYEPGTATAKTTYSDSALSVANTNPVIFDTAGRASIYFEGNADLKIYDSLDVLIFTQPNVNPVANSTVSAITANTTLAASHNLNTIEASGSITLTLTSAVTLGSGWYVYIRNTGIANITLARANVGDSINGTVANYTIRPNEAFRIIVNAAATGFITDTLALGDNLTFAGNNTHSGANTFSGANAVSGVMTFSAGPVINAAPSGTYAAWSTGDVKLTFKTVADTSWVMMNDGTIGNAASGGTTRANADTEALFTLLWTNIIDTWAPVSTGRGASAAADYAANKTITLPRTLGRALAVSGTGATLTARVLGEYLGAETHTLTTAEMPTHSHTFQASDAMDSTNSNFYGALETHGNVATTLRTVNNGGTTNSGSGDAHANMQPSSFFNVMVKL